jgi:hypothetical protein
MLEEFGTTSLKVFLVSLSLFVNFDGRAMAASLQKG